MDNLTHTLMGLGLAKAGLSRRFGRGTTPLLLIASNLPDVDILLSFLVRDAFLFRRMATHSIPGLLILSALLAWIFSRGYRQTPWSIFFRLALGAMGLHVFADLWNSYGVALLWPLTSRRFELAWVFIIDLVVWGLFLAPVILSPLLSRWLRKETVWRFAWVGLAVYLALCAAGRYQSYRLLHRAAAEEGVRADFSYIFPEPFGPQRFRGVWKAGTEYRVYQLVPARGIAAPKGVYATAENDPGLQALRATERVRRLERFFKAPVWKIISANPSIAGSLPVQYQLFDLRFSSTVLERNPPPFVFRFPALPPSPK